MVEHLVLAAFEFGPKWSKYKDSKWHIELKRARSKNTCLAHSKNTCLAHSKNTRLVHSKDT